MSAAPPHPATIVASAGQRHRRAARARAARCLSRNRSRVIEWLVRARRHMHERYTSACGVHAANDLHGEALARAARAEPSERGSGSCASEPSAARICFTEASRLAASGATACSPLSHQLDTCALHLRLEQRCNNRKGLLLKASCQPCNHHSTRWKYEPTHQWNQWMAGGKVAAPPPSVEVAICQGAVAGVFGGCVAALWSTYTRITVVIHHPWRARPQHRHGKSQVQPCATRCENRTCELRRGMCKNRRVGCLSAQGAKSAPPRCLAPRKAYISGGANNQG
jgi:hypothetical protein